MRLGAALALIFLASSAASGDDASAKLAALPGFRATLEARDLVGGRSFGATLAYRAPDRALATISKDEFVWVGDGRLVVRESGELHTTDIAGWLRETEAALAPALKDVDAIAPGAEPPDLAKLAGRLGLSLDLEMRRRDDRVSIALLLAHRYDAAADRAPGFGFTASEGAAVTTAPTTGFPEKVELLGP
ncbi:MAG TPA: hypothetical protein VHF22_14395, partial [Planctomycetota bacterium]|nr:hypothetical protein [Planctomycetota bacterium]